jgi:putative RecB family exonuclease
MHRTLASHLGDDSGRGHLDPYSDKVFPETLSPSRAGDFLTCPLLYRLRVLDKLPEPPSAVAIRGTLVHAALEDLYALPADQRTLDRAADLFAARFDELTRSDPPAAAALQEGIKQPVDSDPGAVAAAVLSPARSLLETYFTLEDPTRLDPHAQELAVSAQLESGLTVRGFIDRVDRAPDGRIRLVDYKTGRSPGSGFEAKAMFQMRFYALVWWRMTGDIPTRLQLLYLGDGQIIHYDPVAADLEATEKKILAIREAISRAMSAGFQPSPSGLCAYCAFHEFCPAQGGTPPAMPTAISK